MSKSAIIGIIIGIVIIIAAVLYFIVDPFGPKTTTTVTDVPQIIEPATDTSAQIAGNAKEQSKPETSPKKKVTIESEDKDEGEIDTEIYVVQDGETLQSIAKKVYGSESAWFKLFALNESEIDDWNLIYAGQKLKIPR